MQSGTILGQISGNVLREHRKHLNMLNWIEDCKCCLIIFNFNEEHPFKIWCCLAPTVLEVGADFLVLSLFWLSYIEDNINLNYFSEKKYSMAFFAS